MERKGGARQGKEGEWGMENGEGNGNKNKNGNEKGEGEGGGEETKGYETKRKEERRR